MSFDLTLIMLLCAILIYFSYKKTYRKLWRVLIFLAVGAAGWILSFVIGYYVGEYQGDKYIALEYVGRGFGLVLIGCIVGVWASKQKDKHSNPKNSK
ncbi:MAG: hypothetical protein ACRBDI_04630 [Alphaproteobacteria bacterium]